MARGASVAEYALVLVAILLVGLFAHRMLGRAAHRASDDGRACLGGDCRAVGATSRKLNGDEARAERRTASNEAASSDADLAGSHGANVGASELGSDGSLVAPPPTEPTIEKVTESGFFRTVESTVVTYPDGSRITTKTDSGWFSSNAEVVTVRADGRHVVQTDSSVGIGILSYSTSAAKVTAPDGRVTVDTIDRKVYAGVPWVVDVNASVSTGTTVGIAANASVLSGFVADGSAKAFVQTSDGHIVGGGAGVDVSAGKGVLAKVGGNASTTVDPVTDARSTHANLSLKAGVGGEVSVAKEEIRNIDGSLSKTQYEGRAGVDVVIVNVGPKVVVEKPAEGDASVSVRPDAHLSLGPPRRAGSRDAIPYAAGKGDPRPASDAKPAIAAMKPAEAKPTEAKPAEAKPAEAKPAVETPTNGCIGASCTRPGSCFVAGTPVWAERGLVPIESLVEGDRVLSRDPESQAIAYRAVVTRFVRDDRPITNLTLTTEGGAIEHVRTTEEHPFSAVGRGFVPAGELAPGDRIETSLGTARVDALFTEATPERVYNVEVDAFHTYFVGQTAAWVHNTCSQPPPPGWTKVKGVFSHGQPVYKHPKKNLYISPDVDGHNVSNGWKMADSVKNLGSKSTRMGTYDADLKRIGN